MTENLFTSIIRLSRSKNKISSKIYYFTIGLVCYLSLYKEEKKSIKRSDGDVNSLGDDIYPLF
jgi:hypothetical protein